MQSVIVQPGDPARNFSLKDQNDKTFDLYEQAKKRTLLSFHPLAWTDFCAAQMKSLEDNLDEFGRLNCVPVGISVDSPALQAGVGKEPRHHADTAPVRLLAARGRGRAVRALPGRERVLGAGERDRGRTAEGRLRQSLPGDSVPDIKEILRFLQGTA